jgi:predicted nucleic acid-binding protein
MKDSFFLDTNVLVYAFNSNDSEKQAAAQHLVSWGIKSGLGVISYQVVQEWFNYAFRKAPILYSVRQAETVFHHLWAPLWKIQSSPALLAAALEMRQRHNFSWYDCFIVAAALEANCRILYSEDLQHGLRIGDLTIQNPFNPSAN